MAVEKLEEIKIRPAKIFDIGRMHAIEKASFPTPWSFDALFTDVFINGNTLYVVAEYYKEIVGYGGMWLIMDEAHITNIAVKQDLRRLGIANRLLMFLEEAALRNGAKDMFLEVRTSNLSAIALYEKHGFKNINIRKKYYRNPVEDAYVMRKDLTASSSMDI